MFHGTTPASMDGMAWDVIVVGAGAAGLAAAHELSRAGRSVLVVEARNRIGGRVHTVRQSVSAMPIELGAEFIHGAAEETFRFASPAAVLIDRLPDVHWWSDGGRLRERPDFWQRIDSILARAAKTPQDVPFAQFLDGADLGREDRDLVSRFVEGYHAADLTRVSSHSLAESDAEQAGDGDQEEDDHPQFRIVSGYDSLLQVIRGDLDPERVQLRLSTVARRIAWRRGGVELHATRLGREETHRARAAIVTLPAGVLRCDAIAWDPAPREVLDALQKIESGNVCKVIFTFRDRFWADSEFLKERIERGSTSAFDMNFVHGSGLDFPTWWTHSPSTVPFFTAWTGGPAADRLLDLDEESLVDRALDSLAKLLGIARGRVDELVESWWTHNWRDDPFSRGAYGYAAVGGTDARRALAEPLDATLFFAGEATEESQSGTVAGAIASGAAAARRYLHLTARQS